ncbi:MAG: efflux RND transporter periplasmic adaptor subunit [Bacteroidales bacterium]|nr:efflux RND transporter periplasmic adaptor subunit [Bacteroidales bacterium]
MLPSQTVLGSLQTDKVKIDFTVPETQASLVKIGNLVKVQNNGSSQSHEARIVALEPQINTASRNVKVRALLNSGSLYPGSFVKVSIEQVHTGISVPTNAIIPDAQSSQVVLVKEGKAVFTNVETGYRTASKVELLNGIAEGDSVIVSGMLFVRPNAVVKVRRSMKPEEVKP